MNFSSFALFAATMTDTPTSIAKKGDTSTPSTLNRKQKVKRYKRNKMQRQSRKINRKK